MHYLKQPAQHHQNQIPAVLLWTQYFYSKNNKNIRDKNFPIVIENAHGVFRKLCNDTLIFKEGAVGKLIDVVKNNIAEKPILFFLNRSAKKKRQEFYIADDFEIFIKNVSFYLTWIAGFGIWEDDFFKIEDKFSGCELSLWQTKTFLEICLNKNKCLIENSKLFDVESFQKKNLSYGLYKVFYENYLGLYEKYLISHNLSDKTFYFLRKDLLFGFFLPWIINIRHGYEQYTLSGTENLYQLILNAYKHEKYFKFFLLKLRLLIVKRHVKKIIMGS
jgi:hypothetical protein